MNKTINNEIIGDCFANNPIDLMDSKIKGISQFKIPYSANSFWLSNTEIISNGYFTIEIKEYNGNNHTFQNMNFRKSGTSTINLIIESMGDYTNTNFLMRAQGGNIDVTISEIDLINNIVLVKDNSPYKVIDLYSLNVSAR